MSRNIFIREEAIPVMEKLIQIAPEFQRNPEEYGKLNLIVVDATALDRQPRLPKGAFSSRDACCILVILNSTTPREPTAVDDIRDSVGGMLDYDLPYFKHSENIQSVFCLPDDLARLKSTLLLLASSSSGYQAAGAAAAAAPVGVEFSPRAPVEDPVTVYKRSLNTYIFKQIPRMPNTEKRSALQRVVDQAYDVRTLDELKAIVENIVRPAVSQHRNPVSNFFASIIPHPLSRRELDKMFNGDNELIKPVPLSQDDAASSSAAASSSPHGFSHSGSF